MIQLTPALPSYFNSSNQLALMLPVSEAAPLSDLSIQRWNSHAKPLEQRFFLRHPLISSIYITCEDHITPWHPWIAFHPVTFALCLSVRLPNQVQRQAAVVNRGPSLPLMMMVHYCCYGNSLNFAVCADLLPLHHVVNTWAHGLLNW